MNLGIYLPMLEPNLVSAAVKECKVGLDSGLLSDASIFFDNIGPTEPQNVCGMFDSTCLWDFTGTLVVVHPNSLQTVKAITNKHDIVYYSGIAGNVNVLQLLQLINGDMRFIATTAQESDNFYRTTGCRTEGYTPLFEGLLELIGGNNDE